jgi:hypothetical protein
MKYVFHICSSLSFATSFAQMFYGFLLEMITERLVGHIATCRLLFDSN